MSENKSVIAGDFDRTDRYDAGLKSLANSLRAAFFVLLLGIIGTLIYFFSGAGYFSVEPQQAVIVLRFGKVAAAHESGGHWYLPYPVNQFIRIQTSQQLLNVDFVPAVVSGGEEDGISLEPGRDTYLLTGDANIVHASWTIAYRVDNAAKYYETLLTPAIPVQNGKIMPDEEFTDSVGMKGTRGPQTFLRNLFRQAVIDVTAESQVGDILYAGQGAYSEKVQQLFTKLVNNANCGIKIDNVGLNRIYPPRKTKAAFDSVTAAGNVRSQLYSEAEAYKVEVENDTKASVAEIIAAAETYKKQLVSGTEAREFYFKEIFAKHKQYGSSVTMALYTAALNEVAAKLDGDKFILGSSGEKKQIRFKLNPEPKKSTAKKPAQEEK